MPGRQLLQVTAILVTMLLPTGMKPCKAWSFYTHRISSISDSDSAEYLTINRYITINRYKT